MVCVILVSNLTSIFKFYMVPFWFTAEVFPIVGSLRFTSVLTKMRTQNRKRLICKGPFLITSLLSKSVTLVHVLSILFIYLINNL